MYVCEQAKKSDFLNEQKNRSYLPVKSKTDSVPMGSPCVQQSSSNLIRSGCFNFPRFLTTQSVVIQRCSESDDEEDENTTYNKMLQLYNDKCTNPNDNFESLTKFFDETQCKCTIYVIKNCPLLLDDKNIYKTLDLIETYSISADALGIYGKNLFDYNNSTIASLMAKSDSYVDYNSFFKEKWFKDKAEERFFNASKNDLDALDNRVLEKLLQSKDENSFLFISNHNTFSKWLELPIAEDTINLGFDTCNALKDLFEPENYPKIPQYALRVNADKRLHFFERCNELSLKSIFSIDGLTAHSRCNEDSVEDGPEILSMINKENHFSDWIAALTKLLEEGQIVLDVSRPIQLSGRLLTYEKIITVKSGGKQIDTFVYHWHPDGIKRDTKNPNVSNSHLKPDKNSQAAATGIDYGSIPPPIKTVLGI